MSTLMRHYFPRRQTPKGREVSEAKLAGEEYFPEEFGDLNDPAIYIPREHYRHGRIHGEKSADEINAEKFSIMDGVGPVNEADIPYMNSFFHTDPSLAIGLRWAESATSRQKKRFIDMVTDWRPMNRKPVEDPMPFMNVGKWVRPDPDNAGMFQQRIMGNDGRNNWVPVDKETAPYVDVEGIAPKFVEEVEIRRAAELAEITAYALARKSGVAPKDAIKVSREAFEKSWNEAPKISMRFKAPKNVSKQITQQLNLMGASTPGSKELKKFLHKNMYSHRKVLRMEFKADLTLDGIFAAYTKMPELLPESILKNESHGTLERRICDYVSGMTDRYALNEHKNLYSSNEEE